MGIALKVAGNSPRRLRAQFKETESPWINPWEPYQIKWIPKKINGRWYKAGDWIYRKFVSSPGGGYWKYGDDFDYMRGR